MLKSYTVLLKIFAIWSFCGILIFIMDITEQIELLEKMLDCRLVFHDVRYRFFSGRKIKCLRKYRNLHWRNPDCCPLDEVASCVKHCVVKLRNILTIERTPCRIWHCRKGYVQLAAPVFRNNTLCCILFAGLWQRPLDKEKIRRISSILPIVAEGLTGQMENFLEKEKDGGDFRYEVLKFLEQHCSENISLHDLAHKLALSSSRTCHLVTEYFGRSFSVLLLELRLEKACYFLRGKYLSVNETARLCGFSSVNYFSAAFRKKYNISPKVYQLKYSK